MVAGVACMRVCFPSRRGVDRGSRSRACSRGGLATPPTHWHAVLFSPSLFPDLPLCCLLLHLHGHR